MTLSFTSSQNSVQDEGSRRFPLSRQNSSARNPAKTIGFPQIETSPKGPALRFQALHIQASSAEHQWPTKNAPVLPAEGTVFDLYRIFFPALPVFLFQFHIRHIPTFPISLQISSPEPYLERSETVRESVLSKSALEAMQKESA